MYTDKQTFIGANLQAVKYATNNQADAIRDTEREKKEEKKTSERTPNQPTSPSCSTTPLLTGSLAPFRRATTRLTFRCGVKTAAASATRPSPSAGLRAAGGSRKVSCRGQRAVGWVASASLVGSWPSGWWRGGEGGEVERWRGGEVERWVGLGRSMSVVRYEQAANARIGLSQSLVRYLDPHHHASSFLTITHHIPPSVVITHL